jgi:hypothetical protein
MSGFEGLVGEVSAAGAAWDRPRAVAATALAPPRHRLGRTLRNLRAGVGDWWRGVAALPGSWLRQARSELLAPVHLARAWRDGGAAAARRQGVAELERQLDVGRTLAAGVSATAFTVARFEPATAPLWLLKDAHDVGWDAAADRHDRAAGALLPDLALAGAGEALLARTAADRAAELEAAADRAWRASAPNAAQAARLREWYAALEASNEGRRLIAGEGAAPFRNAAATAAAEGGAPDEWAKLAGRPYHGVDGQVLETHWVEHRPTGRQVEVKTKPVGWVHVPPRA